MLSRPPLASTLHGSGARMLLIHGDFSTGLQTWRRQISDPVGRELLVIDRRGYGGNSPAEPPFTFALDAEDALVASDESGWDRFDLAGHSYGGLVAIETARRAPARIRSLMLIEPPYMALLPEDPGVVAMREGITRLWEHAPTLPDEQIAEGFFTIIAGPEETARMRASRAWPAIVSQARRAVQAESAGLYPPGALIDLDPALPVAVLTGGRSNIGIQAIARELAHRIPGASLHVSPVSGHVVQSDRACFDAARDALDLRARESGR
ncbi:MAG: alpha/beta fold hydrolase [Thermomicrobiales bacterium]